MSSDRRPFTKKAQCPVVGHEVGLKGIQVTMRFEPPVVVTRSCSNVANCLDTRGPIENINGCLLHNLQK
jgi:hypothetical protein